MDDRALLEAAARAVGIGPLWWLDSPDSVAYYGEVPHHHIFDPLQDDGEALRLAVRLAMTLRQEPAAAAAGWGADALCGAPTHDGRGPWFWKEWITDRQDPYAATRRAIVTAAAALAKDAP